MKFKSIGVLIAMAFFSYSHAQNPIIQTKYTADPAPMVYNDTVFLYVDHDEDADIGFFNMKNWLLYKSTDMVNWTDCGQVASLKTFSKWGRQDNGAWALQCMPRNGKFYAYCPVQLSGIGVAVANTPYGPFVDPIGKPLINNSGDDIDPTIFIDDDGQAYLYWGNPQPYYVKMNSDMTSYSGKITTQTVKPDKYVEGPWLTKRNGLYYLLYAANGIPENLAYATSTSPLGPWTYKGVIMPTQGASFTNHCGVADFKGHSYFMYHTGKLPRGGGFGRSVAIEEFKYNADGTFPTILPTDKGVSPIGTMNPRERVEAETMAFSKGVKVESNDETGVYVCDIHRGDSMVVRVLDFGKTSPSTFTASVASALQGGIMDVRIDSSHGPLLCTLNAPYTGGWEKWQTITANLNTKVEGVHDLYFIFRGNEGAKLFNFDWWKFQ